MNYINQISSPNNQNIIQYQQQQNKRPLSYINSYTEPASSNQNTYPNNQSLDGFGYNTFAGRFFG